MRKLIVKIFNLVYLAGAVLAIVAFCTKPIINTKVGLTLTKEQIADKLMEIFEGRNGSSSEGEGGEVEGASYRISYRDSAADQKITREDIMKAFPNGFSIEVGITIEAKDAFNVNNKSLLKDSIAKSIDKSLDNVIGTVTSGLHNLIYTLTEKFAKTELKNQIDAQIQQYFAGASPVSDADVDALYNNVYETLNGDGTVTVESLADTIVGDANTPGSLLYILEEKKKESGSDHIYVVADPKPTQAEVEEDIAIEDESSRKYYLEVTGDNPATEATEEKYYVRPTSYQLGATYYVQKYDASSVTGEDIADKLAESLDSIPGLVEDKIDAASPTEVEFNATVVSSVHFYRTPDPKGVFAHSGKYDSGTQYYMISDPEGQPSETEVKAEIALGTYGLRQYVVANEDRYEYPAEYSAEAHYYQLSTANPTEEEYYNTAASNKYKVKTGEESYEFAKKWEAGVQYYIETKIVNDVDTALSKLIEEMLGGGSSSEESGETNKAHYRAEGSSSEEELNAAVKEYIQKLLPIDSIYSFTEQADQYSTYVALGLIALFAFPWALFGLVTLIRTLRKRKIWTKPWIVFFFAFLQVIFGVVLTYGTKYAIPLIGKYVPQLKEFLESSQLGLDIRTGCLIPSFVYLAFIPLTIAYIIVAHPVKYEYKMWRRDLRLQRLGRK